MTARPKTRKPAAKTAAPKQCHASEALPGEIDVSALQKMSIKELHDLREAIHTIKDVISSILCQPRFAERVIDMPNVVEPNTAGDVLDNLAEFLRSYEQAAVNVARSAKPSTAADARWRSWTIPGFEAEIADDLASFAVQTALAVRDEAEAKFREAYPRIAD